MTVQELMREAKRRDVQLAAAILLAEPNRLGSQRIANFLEQIHFVSEDRVLDWCRKANVSPWAKGQDLSEGQRTSLVLALVAYLRRLP